MVGFWVVGWLVGWLYVRQATENVICIERDAKKITSIILLGILTHWLNGSPRNPVLHVQVAMWLITWHLASMPQVPGHGSIHFRLEHALLAGQSELEIHSGRQVV